MKNYIKFILFLIIILSNVNLFSQDTDGDGVLDTTETTNGTDLNDACSYNVADVTAPNTAGLDCDNDGVLDATELVSGTNPHDACDYSVADQANPNTNTTGQDCDGDGVLDTTELTNGTDPFDACDYNVSDVTEANTAGQDCDGDGVLDSTELVNGSDPHDPCSYNVVDVTLPNTAFQDCDGDGVLDATELANGTDPHDACSYNVADVTNPNTAGLDCDNDGVLDSTELVNGSDPHDACSYLVADVTEANTAGIDCDNDGVLDTTELLVGTNPHDACDYNVVDVTLANTAGLDCDNDGVDDATELANGTNPHDACSYLVADQSDPNTNTAGQDCDGDGVLDTTELTNGTDPHEPCSYNVADITVSPTALWENMDCDGDGILNGNDTDFDNDGVTNSQETLDSTNPQDFCDFIASSITLIPTSFCNIITGNVFLDVNQDGCGNADDMPMQNSIISATDGTITFSTNVQADGSYELHTDQGNYIITADYYGFYSFDPNGVNFVGADNSYIADFCATGTIIQDIEISAFFINSSPRPGFDRSYRLYYWNLGNIAIPNGTITLNYETSKLNFLNASPTEDGSTSGLLSFNYSNLQPFEQRYINVNFNVLPSNNIGDVLHLTATINPISGDVTPNNNVSERHTTIIGSYDPNDINILEGTQIAYAKKDEYLHYLIRFQNSGTADAINILVSNILDSNLDWDTFQLENSSHPLQVAKENEVVNFIFDNIHLPDETTDEAGSHGFISYKIKAKNDIAIGDVINNQANIYFDFNDAIVTNIATTTFIDTSGVFDTITESINIYPNPTKGSIQIETAAVIKTVSIYNYLGELITKSTSKLIDISKLDNGIYFLKITANNGKIAMKKIVKK